MEDRRMANQLFDMLGGNKQQNLPFDKNNFINKFNQFRQSFQGDPQQQVQQLLNSGRMSQDQFNRLSQMANQIQNMMK